MKSKPQQKSTPRKTAKLVRRFTTPGARPILDLAEDYAINKAVRAVKGAK